MAYQPETNEKSGWNLHPDDRAHVLAAYVHRFTREHIPAWSRAPRPDGSVYKLQYESDAQWLACTYFRVRRDGRLDRRVHRCFSVPPIS